MKPIPAALITGLVMGLLFVLGVLRTDLVAVALCLFALGMVAWTIKQYDQHHLR